MRARSDGPVHTRNCFPGPQAWYSVAFIVRFSDECSLLFVFQVGTSTVCYMSCRAVNICRIICHFFRTYQSSAAGEYRVKTISRNTTLCTKFPKHFYYYSCCFLVVKIPSLHRENHQVQHFRRTGEFRQNSADFQRIYHPTIRWFPPGALMAVLVTTTHMHRDHQPFPPGDPAGDFHLDSGAQ